MAKWLPPRMADPAADTAASIVSMEDQQPCFLVSTLPAHITAGHKRRCLTRTRPPGEVLLVPFAPPRGRKPQTWLVHILRLLSPRWDLGRGKAGVAWARLF